MASLLLSPAHVTHVRCGGSSLRLSWVQEAGRDTKWPPVLAWASEYTYHQPGQPNPITPTTYKLPRLSNSRVPTHPSSLSSSSQRTRADFDPIVSVFVKGGSVIVTRKSHYWAQHDPNNSHELLFHDNSLMRFPNPSFNFFLATVRPEWSN